ncbi:MAG TPA: LysR substrate-binding domain-containing protein [Solirubrobacteraceae bacterium]
MTPELRLIRYFVAVAQEGNVTRAAERLHISQPSLSAAIKQLEQQLGVELLTRHGRRVAITPTGELLLHRGRDLLENAEAMAEEVRRHGAAAGRLRLGLSPTARYGVAPELLAACAAEAPAVMIYTSEDTTGALLRDVADGRLDLAITFCAPQPATGVELTPLRDEPAVVHLPEDHPLAARSQLELAELAGETILVAASRESMGFTDRILSAFSELGLAPQTRTDPYPDLGLQAVRDGLGLVIYARSAFPARLAGSAFVPLQPPLALPFQIAVRTGPKPSPLRTVLGIASSL